MNNKPFARLINKLIERILRAGKPGPRVGRIRRTTRANSTGMVRILREQAQRGR